MVAAFAYGPTLFKTLEINCKSGFLHKVCWQYYTSTYFLHIHCICLRWYYLPFLPLRTSVPLEALGLFTTVERHVGSACTQQRLK